MIISIVIASISTALLISDHTTRSAAVTIFWSVWTMCALTGELGTLDHTPTVYGRNVKFPTISQLVTFGIALIEFSI